jgi:hypothetical protein
MSCFCIDLPSDHGSGLLTGLIAVQSDWYRGNPRKFWQWTSAAPGRLDRGNVNLLHAHPRIECALCFMACMPERVSTRATSGT